MHDSDKNNVVTNHVTNHVTIHVTVLVTLSVTLSVKVTVTSPLKIPHSQSDVDCHAVECYASCHAQYAECHDYHSDERFLY